MSGTKVSAPSGLALWFSLRGQEIRCWCCGVVADRWITDRGKKDANRPVLNLYATGLSGGPVMMTRDHIIPKRYGGRDDVRNLRPGCEDCNSQRGHEMTEEEIQFMNDHPELISEERLAAAQARQQKALNV